MCHKYAHGNMVLIALCFFSWWAMPVHADDMPGPILSQASLAYANGQYPDALAILSGFPELLGVVPLVDQPDPKQRAKIFFDIGRIHIAAGDTALAHKVLDYVVAIEPQTRNGVLNLPRDAAFEETRFILNRLRKHQLHSALQKTSFWGAAGRSIILPGWGQMYRGRKKRGYCFMGATAALAIVWLTTDRVYHKAYQNYRDTTLDELMLDTRTGTAQDPDPFTIRFEKAKSKARLANFALVALSTVWASGVLEHVVVGPGQVAIEISIH